MGCDIHFYVERYTTDEQIGGPIDIIEKRERIINDTIDQVDNQPKWISVDKWSKDDYWTNYPNSFYSNRNYYLFTKLAGVRDYDSTIIPLSKPRGIPDDASFSYKVMVKQMDGDGHSHSYFTLFELLESNVDWSEFSKDFVDTIEKMKKVDADPKKVRCVFFFDN